MEANEIEILLIEDNTSDADMAIRALKKSNLANKLLHLKDGADALDFIFGEGKYTGRQLENSFKVILLDLKMPKVDGIEVLRRVKSDDRTKKIPVVILTSSQENRDIQTCYDLGANGYIVKPVEFDEYQKAISNLGLYWLVTNQSPI